MTQRAFSADNLDQRLFQAGDVTLAPESQVKRTGVVVLSVRSEVTHVQAADALELADAIQVQVMGVEQLQVTCSGEGGCGAPIMWLETVNGRKTPVDPRKRTVIDKDGNYHQGYESHFASCPNADRFRRKKASRT